MIGKHTYPLSAWPPHFIIPGQINTFAKTKKKMRLTRFEIDTIKEVACEVWGNQTVVYLFGSRTDDTKKGGDIDLYIQLSREPEPEKLILQKAVFLGKLDLLLGEQKIDVLIRTHYNKNLPIVKTAKSTGITL